MLPNLSSTTVVGSTRKAQSSEDMTSLGYLAAVNVVIWVGLFAYLWRLDRRLTEKEIGR
jgi:CcmD family protein